MKNEIEFKRVKSDINGNPRYVFHFLTLINEGDRAKAKAASPTDYLSPLYGIALQKAKTIGGRKYNGKDFGGGIVMQSFNVGDDIKLILSKQAVNINFIKEWNEAQFKQVKRAIKNHFTTHTYKHITDHGQTPTDKHFYGFNDVDNFCGLAYTSTGDYAGLWVCNGGYLYATPTHHFIGFAINTDGKVVAIADDENENSIYIEL